MADQTVDPELDPTILDGEPGDTGEDGRSPTDGDRTQSGEGGDDEGSRHEGGDSEPVEIPDELLGIDEDGSEADSSGGPSGLEDLSDEERTLVEGMEDKQRDAFIGMRRELHDLRSKSTHGAAPEEVQTLQQQLRDANETIAKLDLQGTPEFKARFVEPRNQIVTQITEMLTGLGVEEAEKETGQLMSLPLAQRVERLKEVAGDGALAVLPLFTQVSQIDQARDNALASHETVAEQVRQSRQQQVLQFKAQAMKTAVETLAGQGHFVFKKIDGQDKWNKVVDGIMAGVQQAFVSNDPSQQSQLLAAGVAAPFYLKALAQERARRIEAEKQLGSRFQRRPSVRGDQSQRKPSAPKPGEPMTTEQIAAELEKMD